MKILLHDDTPAYFCHGGLQVLVQEIYKGLSALNVEVEFSRWWDPTQKCDLIHLFNASPLMVRAARDAGARVVLTHIADRLSNLPRSQLMYRQVIGRLVRRWAPPAVSNRLWWSIFRDIDAITYLTSTDAAAAISVYGVPESKTVVIPHGCRLDQVDSYARGPHPAHSYLISVGSIVPRKNTILLAKAAKEAGVPVVFLGKPFSDESSYYREFCKLVDGRNVIYPGYVDEEGKSRWLSEASGFVLLSQAESGCIAVYEAAANGLPMLLSDLPWAHSYGTHEGIKFSCIDNLQTVQEALGSFYRASERMTKPTFPVMSWQDIAKQYRGLYERLLSQQIARG